MHNGILLSHKNNKIMPFAATWTELEILILSEIVRKGKIDPMWNLKSGTDEPTHITETDSQTWTADSWLPRGGSGMEREAGVTDATCYT